MPLTYARVDNGEGSLGQIRYRIMDVTFGSSYPAGGENLDNGAFGLASLACMLDAGVGGAGPFNYRMVPGSPNKIQVLRSGPGVFVYAESDIKGSTTTDIGIVGGTLPVNGGLVSALAAANNTTNFTIAASPDIGRNVSVSFKNTNAGASTGNAVSCLITGTFRGAVQTETISFSVAELTSTAANDVATKFGVKPFDTITSITNPVAQPAGWQHAAGIGSKIGLPVPTDNNAEADIIKLTKNAADLSPTGLFSVNQTVNFGVLADGDDVSAEYKISGGEVQTATDLSTITRRFFFLGN